MLLLAPWVRLSLPGGPPLPRRGDTSSSNGVFLIVVLSPCRKSHPTLSVRRSWRSLDVPPRTDTKPFSPVCATASLCLTFAQVPRAGEGGSGGVCMGVCAWVFVHGRGVTQSSPGTRVGTPGCSWCSCCACSCSPRCRSWVLCCRECTLCYGVVHGELLLGVYSQGVQHMTGQPGLLPATVGPYMSQVHITRGVKAENIIED